MTLRRLILIQFIIIMLFGCAIIAWLLWGRSSKPTEITCYERLRRGGDFCLEPVFTALEIENIKKDANDGSNYMAFQLFAYYKSSGDLNYAIHWLSLAARRGSCRAILGMISESEDLHNIQAVKLWKSKLLESKCTTKEFLDEVDGNHSL